ncbi:hypothetical protein, partial [Thiolapillus sp.]|uniref:hypothetical protein n=1 Tax=Thiolapillus sp. TaxID=2017437 RepID=UPI003AF7C53F
ELFTYARQYPDTRIVLDETSMATHRITAKHYADFFRQRPANVSVPTSRDESHPPLAHSHRLVVAGSRDYDRERYFVPVYKCQVIEIHKRVFGLVIDFGTSQSPKSTRPLTTYLFPSRPGHQALRNNFASSLLLRTCLPMTGRRVRRPTLFSLWRKARRENSAASRLLGSTSLRFALHGWQRVKPKMPVVSRYM